MRTAGSLRVILNTKLYRGMPVECPTEKNLRLTGMDDSGILKVFLVTGATKDISNMQAALQFRLAAIEKACAKEGHPALSDEDSDENEDDDCGASKIKAPRLA
jgi:Ran-binding protein 3